MRAPISLLVRNKKTKRAPAEGTHAHTFSRSPFHSSVVIRYVFWLPDRPKHCAFPSEYAPTVAGFLNRAVFVPGYSGGPATDLHRVPLHRIKWKANFPHSASHCQLLPALACLSERHLIRRIKPDYSAIVIECALVPLHCGSNDACTRRFAAPAPPCRRSG